MKKVIILLIVTGVITAGGAASYYLLLQPEESGPTNFVSKWDLMNVIEPVAFSMRGQTFKIPQVYSAEAEDVGTSGIEEMIVELNLVSPGNVRDYPMGRTMLEDGTRVTLTALDDFLSDEIAGKRAVLLRKNTPDKGDEFYFGIIRINGEQVEHLSSLPIGDHIRPRSLRAEGNAVVFNYDVHDRGQAVAETPRINTTATFDIANEVVLIVGRDPKTETVIRYKSFSGEYIWSHTQQSDNRVEPVEPGKFTLRFNANRVELYTDCNTGNSTFITEPLPATTFSVQNISTTSMFCESAQEDEYFAMVGSIKSYEEAEDGTLTFSLGDEDEMVFVPKERALEFGS